jgi:hypothetical protein
MDCHQPIAARKRRRNPRLRHPCPAPAFQPHRLPDARCHQGRTPVPAEIARHLAHQVAGSRIVVRPVAVVLLHLRAIGIGRAEDDAQLVRARLQPLRHIEAIGAVHVEGPADLFAVERNCRDRVESVEDQLVHPAVVRCSIETAAVGPVLPPDPVVGDLVDVDIGIGDQPARQKVEMHAAGYGCRDAGIGRSGLPATLQEAVQPRFSSVFSIIVCS